MNREKDIAATRDLDEMDILKAGWEAMFDEPWDGTQAVMVGAGWDAMRKAALTVNTSTPGNELEYNGLAATRMEELERRVLKLELALSVQMEK